jgi:acetyl esterase/lipase
LDVELRVWDGMWHDFQRFAGRGVIEAQESIDLIGAFTKKRFRWLRCAESPSHCWNDWY